MKKNCMILLAIGLMMFTFSAFAEKPGEEVTVNVSVSSSNAAFATLNFSYDQSVLEYVSATSSYGQASNGQFSLANLGGALNGNVGTITFRVKDNAPAGTYAISVSASGVFDEGENATTLSVSAGSITVTRNDPTPTPTPTLVPTTPTPVTIPPETVTTPPASVTTPPAPVTTPPAVITTPPACTHPSTSWKETKAASCTEPGETQRTCDVCGEVFETEIVPPMGHDDGEWVVIEKPTNTKDGLKQLQCTRCHAVLKEEVIDHITTEWRFNQSVCSRGIRFRDIKPELTKKWFMFTPVDLSKDGIQTIDLIAANITYAGKVTVEVNGDAVKVSYKLNHSMEKGDMAFTILPDLASVNSVELKDWPTYQFGKEISIANDLNGDTKVLLYVLGHVNYDFQDANNEFFTPNDANYQKHVTELKGIMD